MFKKNRRSRKYILKMKPLKQKFLGTYTCEMSQKNLSNPHLRAMSKNILKNAPPMALKIHVRMFEKIFKKSLLWLSE